MSIAQSKESIQAEIAVDEDGCLYYPESGELLDVGLLERHLSADFQKPITPAEVKERVDEISAGIEPFLCENREEAEEALARLARIEDRLRAINARKNAIIDNFDRQIREEQRRIAWWEYRFRPMLVKFAKGQLKGKARTANFDMGRVKFLTVRGRPQIVTGHEDAAVAWCRKWNPGVVKTKSETWVTATDAAKVLEQVKRETEDPSYTVPFLAFSQDHESITISTGVEKE
jgi:hypothetical protein